MKVMPLVYFLVLFLIPALGISDPPVEEWVALYDGPCSGDDTAYDMVLDSEGNVYVTGSSYDDLTDYDYVTIKYDSDGNELWARRYDGPASSSDEAYSITLDDSSNVYVTGWSYGITTSSDYATVKYDSNGNQIWVARYNGLENGIDAGTDLVVDKSQNVYVTGMSWSSSTGYNYATVSYDNDGMPRWVMIFNGAADAYDEAVALTLDNYENVIITGSCVNQQPHSDYATICYDGDGTEQWKALYNSPDSLSDIATDIAADEFGNIYITGVSDTDIYSRDYLTIKYDSSGEPEWTARYDGPGNDTDYAEAIAVDSRGNVYVTGESIGIDTYYDFATVKYDSSGNQAWIARFNGPLNDDDEAYAIAVDEPGNVYVTGYQTNADSDYDYVTIMYDSSGTEQWQMIYDGSEQDCDEACAIAVDDAGNVYVTGYSYTTSANPDIVTIRYSQSTNIDPSEETVAEHNLSLSPNPSRGMIRVSYYLPESVIFNIGIYDISGRILRMFEGSEQTAGLHHLDFDDLSTGLYFCRFETAITSVTESFVVIR